MASVLWLRFRKSDLKADEIDAIIFIKKLRTIHMFNHNYPQSTNHQSFLYNQKQYAIHCISLNVSIKRDKIINSKVRWTKKISERRRVENNYYQSVGDSD